MKRCRVHWEKEQHEFWFLFIPKLINQIGFSSYQQETFLSLIFGYCRSHPMRFHVERMPSLISIFNACYFFNTTITQVEVYALRLRRNTLRNGNRKRPFFFSVYRRISPHMVIYDRGYLAWELRRYKNMLLVRVNTAGFYSHAVVFICRYKAISNFRYIQIINCKLRCRNDIQSNIAVDTLLGIVFV